MIWKSIKNFNWRNNLDQETCQPKSPHKYDIIDSYQEWEKFRKTDFNKLQKVIFIYSLLF